MTVRNVAPIVTLVISIFLAVFFSLSWASEPQAPPTNKYRIEAVVNPNEPPFGALYIERQTEDHIELLAEMVDPDKDHMTITWSAWTPNEPAKFSGKPTIKIRSPGRYSFRCKVWLSAEPITIKAVIQDGHKLAAHVEKTWFPQTSRGATQ